MRPLLTGPPTRTRLWKAHEEGVLLRQPPYQPQCLGYQLAEGTVPAPAPDLPHRPALRRCEADIGTSQVNPEYISVNWESGGGGAFAVIPVNERGKLPDQIPLFRGHTAAVLDTDWCVACTPRPLSRDAGQGS